MAMPRTSQALDFTFEDGENYRVRVGLDDDGRRRNRLEVRGRQWAASHGIQVPHTMAHDPGGAWLVTQNLTSLPQEGEDFVDAGLDVAARIGAMTPLTADEEISGWKAPLWSAGRRAILLARAGISPQEFFRVRGRALELPATHASHGDLHDGNILYDNVTGATVIDWEHTGTGPEYADALRLVTTLEIDADADYAFEAVMRDAPQAAWPAIGAQLRWLALRHLADHCTTPEPIPEPRMAALHRRWKHSGEWARQLQRGRK